MASETEYARIITKSGTGIATIPPSADHSNGDWISTDIYEKELYLDESTGKIYTNLGGVIVELNPDAPLATNFANTDLTFTGDRTHDLDGFNLDLLSGNIGLGDSSLSNCQVVVGSSFDYGIYIPDSGVMGVFATGATTGVRGSSSSGTGVSGDTTSGLAGSFSASSGIGLKASSASNKSAAFRNQVLIEEYSAANDIQQASALFEVKSVEKGVLFPRMTTTERDAISSPATGLEIYNTTNNRKEVYNGSYWGAITPTVINLTSGSASLTSGSNYFFGNTTIFPTTTSANRQFLSPVSGVIRKAFIRSFAGTVAGDRSINVYIRINSTDYLVATVASSSANREFINTSLNIPVVANTDTVVCYAVASGGTTDSTGVYFGGQIIVE